MTPGPSTRPQARLATDIAHPLTLSDQAKALITPNATARQFFDALLAASLPDDAIRFLAAALPKRESVWWGCLCLKDTLANSPDPHVKAFRAAEKWAKEPNEVNRRAAGEAAGQAGYGNPSSCLAAAAFWSGGSLAPPNLPTVPPRDDLTGLAVAGALLLAAASHPQTAPIARQRFLEIGADVATGKVKV